MKFLGFILINNRRGKYAVVDIQKRIREVYLTGGIEAAYLAYRTLTGVGKHDSHMAVRKMVLEEEK